MTCWFLPELKMAVAHSKGRILAISAMKWPGDPWRVIAVETTNESALKSAFGPSAEGGVFDNHAHAEIGTFDSFVEAELAVKKFVRSWRRKPLAAKCVCAEIGGAGGKASQKVN